MDRKNIDNVNSPGKISPGVSDFHPLHFSCWAKCVLFLLPVLAGFALLSCTSSRKGNEVVSSTSDSDNFTWGQDMLVYFPTKRIYQTPEDFALAYEDVWLKTVDGQMHAWWVPAGLDAPAVVFFHGNGGNISYRMSTVNAFVKMGYSVLIVDYPGYGKSQGKPTEQGTYRTAESAWRYVRKAKKVPAEKMFIFGRSLGGGVASYLAVREKCAGLILESTFTSIPDVARKKFWILPAEHICKIYYNTNTRLPKIHSPVMVIHSMDDDLIPYSMGVKNFNSANEPKTFLQINGSHNAAFDHSINLWKKRVGKFMTKCLDEKSPDKKSASEQ